MSGLSMINYGQREDTLTRPDSVCSVCGQRHNIDSCPYLQDIQHVTDAPVISRARQTLPDNLEIVSMADGSTTVITKVDLAKGTTFGPLYARKTSSMNLLSDFPIKVFGNDDSETYYLDLSNENFSNWMCFIPPASNAGEQNLICYQVNQDIYFTAMRDIVFSEELRVWYAPYYALKMQMPLHNKNFGICDNVTVPEMEQVQISNLQQVKKLNSEQTLLLKKEVAEELAEKLPAHQLGATNNVEVWNCKFCLTATKSVVSYAKHLMDHYKPLLGIFCNICSKKCNNASVLKRHKKMKHPHEDEINRSSIENQFQDSESPFLLDISELEKKSLDGTKSLSDELKSDKKADENDLQIYSLTNDKENTLDSSLLNVGDLLQTDKCLSMNLSAISESILPDHSGSQIKFNVDELVPELLDTASEKLSNFDCDICGKKFDKVDYLYRHLRKHTGEFICPSCLVVFARKENLLSHACLSRNMEYNYECSFCHKLFIEKKYLKRHMAKHNEAINCKWCHSVFSSTLERAAHKCSAPHYVCEECNKRFVHKAHLNRHIQLHNNPQMVRKRTKRKKGETESAICEKCGEVFGNPYSLKQHLTTHGERMFECDVCHSRFHRMAILKEHKTIHQSAQIPCDVCGKRLKSKKALDIHMLLHGNKKFQCEKCDKSFFQKCNYLKHYKQIHGEKTVHNCSHCPMVFTNKYTYDKHITRHTKPTEYSCTLCVKSFRKEYQLKRHVQTSHSGIIYRCPFCNMTARHRHSMRRHFERQHENMKQDWDKPGFVNQLVEISSQNMVKLRNTKEQENIPAESYLNMPDHCLVADKNDVPGIAEDCNIQMQSKNDLSEEEVMNLMPSSTNGESDIIQNDDAVNEITQLNISEDHCNEAESVLRSAYIYDDDGGDIMFYVLQ